MPENKGKLRVNTRNFQSSGEIESAHEFEVDFYTEVLFRKKNVRFIAISNNVDSALNDGILYCIAYVFWRISVKRYQSTGN